MVLIVLICLLFVAAFVFLQWLVAKTFEEIASLKGHDEKKYFWFCFWLGLIGYLMVVALPNCSEANTSSNSALPTL